MNLLLIGVSCLVGFLVSELAYRVLESHNDVRRPQRTFWAYSNSVWEFDAALGYHYPARAHYDAALLQGGIPRRCGTFVSGPLGAPGKGLDPKELSEVKLIVLGDSFTAMVHQGETWPDILSSLIEERSGHPVSILNLARDGYGVLQMFDQAAELVRAGHRPHAFIISIIGADLTRARFWRMTRERGGTDEVFTSTVPSLDVSTETHVRMAFVDPGVTQAWCEEQRSAGKADETGNRIERAFEATWRADDEFLKRRIDLLSLTECYLCNLVRLGRPTNGIIPTAANPAHKLTSFEQDKRFVEDLATIRDSAVPIWLIYLPYAAELRNARTELAPQERSLMASLKSSVDRSIDLSPDAPMGDAATRLTLLPEDVHPSYAGLQYYAEEAYRRIMPLEFKK